MAGDCERLAKQKKSSCLRPMRVCSIEKVDGFMRVNAVVVTTKLQLI